jgi:putative acetyltransferase
MMPERLSDRRRARARSTQGACASALIREMRPEEARIFLEVHHAAVRGLAARGYAPEVIDAWAPLPILDEHVDKVRSNPDGELRLVAEIDGRVVGVGSLVAENDELRACYVTPRASRRGIGSALVRAIELAAREQGMALLHLDSSTTAEPFYAALGYEARERGEHILGNGRALACVKMRKRLVLRSPGG